MSAHLTKQELRKEIIKCGKNPAYFINNYAKWAAAVDRRLRPHNTANGARFKFMKAMRSREMRQLASPDKIKRTIRKFRQRNHIGVLTRRLEKDEFPEEV